MDGSAAGRSDPEDALEATDVQHRRRVAGLGRDGPNSFEGRDEDREADAERDDRDEHPVAKAVERDDECGNDRDGRCRSCESTSGSSVRRTRSEAPMTSPMPMPIPDPIAKPAARRFRLAATSDRNSRAPDLPCPLQNIARRRHQKRDRGAQTSQTTSAPAKTTSPRTVRPATAVVPLNATRHAPRRPRRRRGAEHAQHDVDRVAEERGQQDGRVQLREPERELLLLHVRADSAGAVSNSAVTRPGARSTR